LLVFEDVIRVVYWGELMLVFEVAVVVMVWVVAGIDDFVGDVGLFFVVDYFDFVCFMSRECEVLVGFGWGFINC